MRTHMSLYSMMAVTGICKALTSKVVGGGEDEVASIVKEALGDCCNTW